MKISLAWVFDYIQADLRSIDIEKLISKFNQVTAEIEHFSHVKFDMKEFFICRVEDISEQVRVFIPELKKSIDLSSRPDAIKNSQTYLLLKQSGSDFEWATLKDFDLDKSTQLPAFWFKDDNHALGFREVFESEDIILDVDNKSLTHRPDMWGHRGFAREIAALLDLPFKDKSHFLAAHKTKQEPNYMLVASSGPITIENRDPQNCTRVAGIYCKNVSNKPSNMKIASRLFKVGMKPINAIVDLTNYVMFDWSQPMHAFDAAKLSGNKFVLRAAKEGEKLTLLDGKQIELSEEDLVTANDSRALGLAGIMGGAEGSISDSTKSIFLEVANFDPTTIRKSALRHKTRTESSARFEKTIDPNQIVEAILRFIKLAKEIELDIEIEYEIALIGEPLAEKIINLSQVFIDQRAGFAIPQVEIVEWLSKIGFGIEVVAGEYKIRVPSFRGTKDVEIKEDILEEIFRFYGFNNIQPVLPAFAKPPTDISPTFIKRKVKEYLTYAALMSEAYNYAVYDEAFLKTLGFDPQNHAPVIKNPISENNVRLVTSLIPHLLKNISENLTYESKLSFFELARTWDIEDFEIKEKRCISGIFFNKHGKVDFYDCKKHINQMLRAIDLEIEWEKEEESSKPWMNKYQTALLKLDGNVLGYAGKVDSSYLLAIGALMESEAFAFELDYDLIVSSKKKEPEFKKLPKFQDSSFDLSFIVPIEVTCAKLENHLKTTDPLLTKVYLVDYFEKSDWNDKKALAFRFILNNPQKTLDKDEIEAVRLNAIRKAEELGASLRS